MRRKVNVFSHTFVEMPFKSEKSTLYVSENVNNSLHEPFYINQHTSQVLLHKWTSNRLTKAIKNIEMLQCS